jgi:hypothetical protein
MMRRGSKPTKLRPVLGGLAVVAAITGCSATIGTTAKAPPTSVAPVVTVAPPTVPPTTVAPATTSTKPPPPVTVKVPVYVTVPVYTPVYTNPPAYPVAAPSEINVWQYAPLASYIKNSVYVHNSASLTAPYSDQVYVGQELGVICATQGQLVTQPEIPLDTQAPPGGTMW